MYRSQKQPRIVAESMIAEVSATRSEAAPQPVVTIQITSPGPAAATRQPCAPRDIPTQGCKYLQVWQRLRVKVKSQLFLQRLGLEIQLFGTNTYAVPALEVNSAAINQLMRKRLEEINEPGDLEETLEPRFLFKPNSCFKTLWACVFTLLMFYTVFVLPYVVAFLDSPSAKNWFWVNVAVDVLFFVDVLVTFNSAYLNESGELVSSRKQIFWSYFKTWLIVDLLACFPFYLVHEGANPEVADSWTYSQYKSFFRIARIPRIYRFLRLTRVFSVATNFQMNAFVHKLIESFCGKGSVFRLLATTFMVSVCIHIVACLWYFMARLEGFSPETWVSQKGLRDASPGQLYLTSLYWTITTLSTVGYGDIVPGTSRERLLATAWMFFGIFFYSFTIGSLATMVRSGDSREAILTMKLTAIDEFAAEGRLGKDLRFKLRNALRYSIEQSGFSPFEKRAIFNELPKELRYEVACAMHDGAAKTISFFSDRDPVFVASFVPFLTKRSLPLGKIVYKENDYADEMYFIAEGRCKMIFDGKYELKKLHRGSYFGEIEMIQQIPRKFTVAAMTDIDLLSMDKQMFSVIKSDFPTVYEEMKEIAATRNHLNEKAKEHFVKVLDSCKGSLNRRKSELPPIPRALPKRGQSFTVKIIRTRISQPRKSMSIASSAEDRLLKIEKLIESSNKLAKNILKALATSESAQVAANVKNRRFSASVEEQLQQAQEIIVPEQELLH